MRWTTKDGRMAVHADDDGVQIEGAGDDYVPGECVHVGVTRAEVREMIELLQSALQELPEE
jgi:hypothetical protein